MILFYGCWNGLGHYMHDQFGQTPRGWERLVPWGYNVDGDLAPPRGSRAEAPNGVAGFHQSIRWVGCPGEEVWSALSWWDNSVDTRPGSSCTFLVDRRATPEEVLEEAKRVFPQIFERFRYPIVLPKYGSELVDPVRRTVLDPL